MAMTLDNTLVLLVDIQERLLPHIHENEELLNRMKILLQGVKTLELPLIVNEQYKKGLGETVEPLRKILGEYNGYEKVTFSCCKNETTLDEIKKLDKKYVVLFGIETHICVQQTALDLLENGFQPVLIADCVGSRKPKDTEIALARMTQAGVILTTYESFLFEVLTNAKHEKFKEISKIVK